MATVPVVPGKTAIQLKAIGRGHKTPPQLAEMPGGLFPLKSAAFVVDEYRLLSGWPVPVPDCDVRIECLVSAEGALLGNRDSPLGLITNADMRWVADSDYYDQVSGKWTPLQGEVSPWTTAPDSAPTLVTDYEYRNGNERFIEMTALNFDSNTRDFMANDLGMYIGGISGYTVLMAMSPNSIYGNDPTITSHAIWAPQAGTGSWVMFTIENQAVCLTTESQRTAQQGVAFGNALAGTAPTYLALVVNRPTNPAGRPAVTMYAASGPSNVVTKALVAQGAPDALSASFWLGKGPFTGVGTADMALFDLGIYANPLTQDQVVGEITSLSTVYGGDS
jgi:hypothetical protein